MSLRFSQLDSVWITHRPPSFSIFLTFQDQGRYYILQRGFPHYLGEILRGAESEIEGLIIADRVAKAISLCQVTGYKIWIIFAGALDGDKIIIEPDWKPKMDSRMRAMADFYLLDRIRPSMEKFKKFRISV